MDSSLRHRKSTTKSGVDDPIRENFLKSLKPLRNMPEKPQEKEALRFFWLRKRGSQDFDISLIVILVASLFLFLAAIALGIILILREHWFRRQDIELFHPDNLDGPPWNNFSHFLAENPNIRPTQVSSDPQIWFFDGVFSQEECEQLLNLQKVKRMTRSTVVGDTQNFVHKGRTSSDTVLRASPINSNSIINRVNRRISQLIQAPEYHGETLIMLRYEPGQEYKPHMDCFSRKPSTGGNRMATVLVFLNWVREGGETGFTDVPYNLRFDGGMYHPASSGYQGGKIRPVPGRVLVWYNMKQNDKKIWECDKRTKHAGVPVINGTKYILTKWVREKRHLKFPFVKFKKWDD